MNITEFNTLYQLVLEGRAYSSVIPGFGLGFVISAIVTFFLCLAIIIQGIRFSDIKYYFIGGLSSSILFCVGLFACSFKASLKPTMDDVKIITAYKVGESVVNSEEFNTVVHKLIDAIPQNNK